MLPTRHEVYAGEGGVTRTYFDLLIFNYFKNSKSKKKKRFYDYVIHYI